MVEPGKVPFWKQFLVIFAEIGGTALFFEFLGPRLLDWGLLGLVAVFLAGASVFLVIVRVVSWALHVRVTWRGGAG